MTRSTEAEIEPLLEESTEVAAPPVQVWALVSDLARMAGWSPQVVRTFVRGGPVSLGTRTINVNRRGPLVWPTRSKVIRFEPHREIAFRVLENSAVWSFTLEPTGSGGTRIIQRREVPDGLSTLSMRMTDLALGGQARFTSELRDGMRRTLARISSEVEPAR